MATTVTPTLVSSSDGTFWYFDTVDHNTQNQGERLDWAIPSAASSRRFRLRHLCVGVQSAATAPDVDANNWSVQVHLMRSGQLLAAFDTPRVTGRFADGLAAPFGWSTTLDTSAFPIVQGGDELRLNCPISDTDAVPAGDYTLSIALTPVA